MSKIALFIPNLEGGGAERATLLLAENFIKKGYKVDLILIKRKGPYLKMLPPDINIITIDYFPFSDRIVAYAANALLGLRKYLKKNKPDYFISALTGANLSILLIKSLYNVQTPIITVEHNTLKNLRSSFYLFMMKRLYNSSDKIITVSNGIAKDIQDKIQINPQKIHVIYNPHDIDLLKSKALSTPDHRWFRQPEIPIILAIGRLCPQKDFSTLIKAFALARKRKKIRLIILGEGEELSTLKELAQKLNVMQDIDFPGFKNNPFCYLKNSSLYVLSSKWEGLPNTLIEALIIETPIVATNCHSGPAEILENGKLGLLVPVGDPVSLSNAILKQIDNKGKKENMARIYEKYRPEKVADLYINVINTLYGT